MRRGVEKQMKNFSLKKCFSVAKVEFVKWVCDARMIVIAVMIVFIYNFAVTPLLENAEAMNKPLNVFEPFIAVANSSILMLIIPLVFLTLIADFPRIDTNTVFYIIRVGRVNWLVGQVIKLVMMAVSFLAAVFIGSVAPMAGKGTFSGSWSEVTTRFLIYFPDKVGNFGHTLIPENLYNQMSLTTAAAESYLLAFAYILILGMILLSFSLIKQKTMGFVLCGTLISVGTAFCSVRANLMWTMPMANSIIWIHYTRYFSEPLMPMWFSVTYLLVMLAALLIFSGVAIHKFNYDNVAEISV